MINVGQFRMHCLSRLHDQVGNNPWELVKLVAGCKDDDPLIDLSEWRDLEKNNQSHAT